MSTNRSESTLVMIAGHNHDDRYFTQTELSSKVTAGTAGAKLIGAFDEFSNSNSDNVQAVLKDFDAAISSAVSGGEVNTASNQGIGGIGVFYQKSIYDLQFKNLRSADGHLTLTDDTSRHEIKFETNATNLNTVNTIVARDASGNFSAGTITADLAGNASTASQLETARTIGLSGDVSGSASFDGSANATITTVIANDSHTHDTRYYTESESDARFLGINDNADSATKLETARTIGLSGDVSGSASFDGTANATITATIVNDSHTHDTRYYTESECDANFLGIHANADTASKLNTIRAISLSGDVTGSANFDGSSNTTITATVANDSHYHDGRYYTETESDARFLGINDNADSATKLETARTIGLSGDVSGSASFDGTANATITATVANDSHTHDTRYYTESECDNLFADDSHNHTLSDITDSGTAASYDVGTSSGDIPILDGSGKISTSVLPALAITETHVVADIAARDALSVQEGDVAIVNDDGSGNPNTYIYDGSSWQELKKPASGVSSVAGKTGDVTLTTDDVSEGSDLYFTNERAQDAVGTMVTGNTELGISVTYDDGNGKLNFNVNDPTISLSGDVSGSATMTNLGNVNITATVANDSHYHDGRYYTETESDARFLGINAKASDSDRLDGLNYTQFVRSDTTDTITGIHTYDKVNQQIKTHYNQTGYTGGWARGIYFEDDGDVKYGGLGSYGSGENHYYFYFGGGTSPWTNGMRMYENGNAYFTEDVTVVGTLTGNLTGNASTATKLATARTIGLSGDVSGSASFDGSANATITATVANDSHTHDTRYYTESESNARFLGINANAASATKLNTARTIGLSGDVSGSASFDGSANITITAAVANDSHYHDGRYFTESETDVRYLRRNATSLPTVDNTYALGDGSHRWSDMYAVNFNGTATYAKYADLAEKYTIDGIDYQVGDVVVLSPIKDVDVEKSNVVGSNCVIGVISDNPAFAMNNDLEDGIYIGLKGRLMCKVKGPVRKTDSLISGIDGCAIVPDRTMILRDDTKYFAVANDDIETDEIKLIEVIL